MAPTKTALMIHAVGDDSMQLKMDIAELDGKLPLDNQSILHVKPHYVHVGVALTPDLSTMAAMVHRQKTAAPAIATFNKTIARKA